MPERAESGPDEPPQLVLMQRLVELSQQRTDMSAQRSEMSAQRSEMSAERSYMNAERTLSVWIRTALATIVVGLATDRLRLFLLQHPGSVSRADHVSAWVGDALVALGVLMAVTASLRFRLYAAMHRRTHAYPSYHGPFMAAAYGLLVALAGLALLILLIVD